MVVTRRQSAAIRDETDSRLEHTEQEISSVAENQQTERRREEGKKKKGDFWVRLISGLFLSFGFVGVVYGGHVLIFVSILCMEIGMFHEILRLGFNVAKDKHIPLWRTTGWYFFMAMLFLFYGKPVLSHFEDQQMSFMKLNIWKYLLNHHSFVAFCMYCSGFVGFVLSLKQDQYAFQFTYFGRALVALLLVVVQSHFMMLNTVQGIIWFVLPCWLIICNDSFAYFCGKLFGKHSLTILSPKKTWEGYIGAGIFTMITAYFLSGELSKYPSLICPRYDFDDCFLFCQFTQCQPIPSIFLPITKQLTNTLSITYRPIQLHSIALGFFASSIAPFGGFFASGAKRAFGIKDFGAILPGHGGVTDRVDCQLMMAVFTYVYLINFVRVSFVGSPDVGKLITFVAELSTREQVELLSEIYTRLKRRGVDYIHLEIANQTTL